MSGETSTERALREALENFDSLHEDRSLKAIIAAARADQMAVLAVSVAPITMTMSEMAIARDASRRTPGKAVLVAEIDALRGALAAAQQELGAAPDPIAVGNAVEELVAGLSDNGYEMQADDRALIFNVIAKAMHRVATPKEKS